MSAATNGKIDRSLFQSDFIYQFFRSVYFAVGGCPECQWASGDVSHRFKFKYIIFDHLRIPYFGSDPLAIACWHGYCVAIIGYCGKMVGGNIAIHTRAVFRYKFGTGVPLHNVCHDFETDFIACAWPIWVDHCDWF